MLRPLLLSVALEAVGAHGGFPCDAETEWVQANWRPTQHVECHSCFECAVGQVCRQRGGCFNCSAGYIDDDSVPTSPCTACPDGKTSEEAAGPEGCYEMNQDVWDWMVDQWSELDTVVQLVIGGSCSAIVLACGMWICCNRCQGGLTGEDGLCDQLKDALCPDSDAEKAAAAANEGIVKAAQVEANGRVQAAWIQSGEYHMLEDEDEDEE